MPLPHLTICEEYSGHLLHNWNKGDLIALIGSLSVLTLCWDGATSACRTQLKTNVSPTAMKSLRGCSSGSLSREKNARLESKELHGMSLKARMNVMPSSGRKSAEVSICHSLLCHARRRMRPKHPQNMLQAGAPWLWSLHAPVLRAQPVQQERTTNPSSHWLLDIEKQKKSEKIPEVSSAVRESRLSTD